MGGIEETTIQQANDFIESNKWVFAKTYKDFAPHEYVVVKGNSDIVEVFKTLVQENGVDEEFTIRNYKKTYRYWHNGEYKYWVMGAGEDQPDVKIINRAKI